LGGFSLSVRQRQFGWRRLIGSLLPLVCLIGMAARTAVAVDPLASSPTSAPGTGPQPSNPTAGATRPIDTVVAPDLLNRTVEEVRVVGNAQVSTQMILNQVRTRVGEKFQPQQVQEDYQRIYSLKRFANVQAKVEPTATGVIVIFEVTEEKLIHSIQYTGNHTLSNDDLRKLVDLQPGEAIEPFRISLARRAIIASLRSKNHPFSHVDVDMSLLTQKGALIFNIIEGPKVTVRKIDFIGNKSFTANELDLFGKLNDQIKTHRWLWIFDEGNYDPETVEEDVGSIRHFYQTQGFFDVKVGRKLIFSPDQSELEIDYLIDEGPRYKISRISFTGNTRVPATVLRKDMNLTEGKYFDSEQVQHDVKQIIKAYSPLGYVVDPQSTDPGYLQIGKPDYPFIAKLVYHKQPGTVDLIYEISEGHPFRMGNILIKGNKDTQDKVVIREIHAQPGQLYDSGALTDAVDRLRSLPEFSNATITPIGNSPDTRDVLVQVTEKQTANISLSGQVDSNYGLGGTVNYTQKNFDITNFPNRIEDFWSADNKPFTGAGQIFSATFSPGVDLTTGQISFTEPYLFDQPYSNTDKVYYTQQEQEAWYERRTGGLIGFGKQWNDNWSSSLTFQAEDVYVGGITDYYPLSQTEDVISPVTRLPIVNPDGRTDTEIRSERAPEIIADAGHNVLTNIGLGVRWDTTNPGPLTYKGARASFEYQYYGAMGGDYHFSKLTAGFDSYSTLATDALDRKFILNLHADGGYITPDAPFFERFYGGGRGSIRGFEYRGLSPRDGRASDPIGGDFQLMGSAELSFPLYGDNFRGVVFTDLGTVEQDIRIHTIRESVGAGVRVVIPLLSPVPLAFDVAFPVLKGDQDNTEIFSFGVGIRN
jgi:outer membrane protein insertion porin family